MGKNWLTLMIVIVGLSLVSCGAPSDEDNVAVEEPSTPTEETTTSEPEPDVEEEVALTERVPVSGLIPPTDPQVRAETIPRGVNDPFEHLPVEPVVPPTEDQIASESPDNSLQLPPDPPPEATEPSEETEPKTTTPEFLAESVVVTGIVQLEDAIQIILKAPRESFSRYVQIGQYISNGEILVKRVEGIDSRTPVVILEQSGKEVRRPIGLDSTNAATTQASL